MKEHELEVENKEGQELTVSIEHYKANKGELTPLGDEKEIKAHIDKHEKAKVKMEKEQLKNKSDND